MNVTKRDGKTEPLDFDKVHKVVMWACNDITGVSMSEVEMAAQIQFNEGIKTEDIHRTLVKAAADLVTEKAPNYQFVAGRLVAYDIQKRVNGGPNHPRLFQHVSDVVADGFYDPDLLVGYTEEQWDEMESIIDYERETEFTYAAMETFRGKYLLRDRTTGTIKETPLQSYITLCATAMMNEPVEKRFGYIKDMYKLLCDGTISLPTPIMAGLRSTEKQFSSCVLVETGDDLDTITSASAAIVKYVSKKAGIGINGGQIRAVGSPIRNGAVTHTGLFSFYRYMDASVRAVSQGGVRSAAATLNYPWWHYEFMDMIELKNRTGTEDNRLRHMDYCVQFNKLFYARYLAGADISLFSPSEVDGLYESFFNDQDKFKELYEKAEKDKSIRRITIPSKVVMSKFIEQRKETGRIYFSNVDHVNSHGSYDESVAPIRMTNLCVTGDTRVVSSHGLLTAKVLNELDTPLELFDGETVVSSSKMKLRGKDEDVWKVSLSNGMSMTVTEEHRWPIANDSRKWQKRKFTTKTTSNLDIGDKIPVQVNKGLFGSKDMQREAFLLGQYQSDGTQSITHKENESIHLCLWENDFDLRDEIKESFDYIHSAYGCDVINTTNQTGTSFTKPQKPSNWVNNVVREGSPKKVSLVSRTLKKALNFEKGYVPSWIYESNEDTQWQYVRGLLYADGSVSVSTKTNGSPISISYVDTNYEFLQELQILFRNLGLSASIYIQKPEGYSSLPDSNGNYKDYYCKTTWRLIIGNKNDAIIIEDKTKFLSRKGIVLDKSEYRDNTRKTYDVVGIDYVGKQDVFCPTVDSDEEIFVANGMLTHNCTEIGVPTNPMKSLDDPEGEIGVCTLFAINYGNINKPEDFEKPARIAVRVLNNILDYQDYPVETAKKNALGRRPLGGGIVNFAYYLAKNDMTYSNPDLEVISDMVEAHSYWLHKASADMAVERGACELFHETKYAKGILPIDTYKGAVDQLVAHNPKQDWEGLRKQILETGILNSSLMAIMPAECQSLDNEMLLGDGTVDTLENLLKKSGIDVDSVHESGAVGQRFDLLKPLQLKGREVNQCYYNGIRETTDIEFSDGSSYRFTDNHKLLVDVAGEPLWGRVDSLREGDKMFSDKEDSPLFVSRITPNFSTEHTWDVSTNDEQYILANGATSHNTSAAVSNSTNGIEPVRGLITFKQTKDTVMPQVVPSIQRYKNKYEKLWDMPSPKGYLDIMAIIQKWGDQAISVNFTYTPSNYENDTIPESVMVGDLLNFYKYGGKNGYYSNTLGIQESDIIEEPACDSCVL